MSIWERFLFTIGLRPTSGPRTFEISESLHSTLVTLAQHEGRPENEFANELLAAGLTQYFSKDELYQKWESLTPREKEVTAMLCLGYTNRQAAARMSISSETVKFHARNLFEKFGVKSRSQLQQLLSNWDWSPWAGT
jgi:DNA-binding CsgD family transcriptional regulator